MQVLDGRYALVPNEEPRSGGMAEIRRAVDMVDGQKSVAIKLFKPDIDADRLHLEAYSRECRALQRLDHPNIVRILDGGTDRNSGRRFLVLEWLETSLLQHVAAHPLAGWDTFYETIGRPVLDGLTYAYGQDILHRDLKPQNVLFSPDGVIKVADFGISKLRSYLAPGVTVAGFRSEPYTPPESDVGTNSESRDVFGFAVLALACLGDLPLVTYDQVYCGLDDFDGPPEVVEVLRLALSRDPNERPRNVVDLKDELDRIHNQREAGFNATSQRRRFHVKITRRVEEKLQHNLNHSGMDVTGFVLDDLNEICGLKRYVPPTNKTAPSAKDDFPLALYAAQYVYHAFIDRESRGYLVVHNAMPWQPSFLEFQRDSAWTPHVEYSLLVGASPPADGTATMDWLVGSLAQPFQGAN